MRWEEEKNKFPGFSLSLHQTSNFHNRSKPQDCFCTKSLNQKLENQKMSFLIHHFKITSPWISTLSSKPEHMLFQSPGMGLFLAEPEKFLFRSIASQLLKTTTKKKSALMKCCRCKHTNAVYLRCKVRRSRKSIRWPSCWRTCLCSHSGSQMFRPGLLCCTSSSCWTSETNQTCWLCPSLTASASATRNESEETFTSRGRNTAWRLEPTPWPWAC